MKTPTYIDRPPRIQPELPFAEIEIPKPPEISEQGYDRLIQIGLPLLTIVGYVLVSTFGGSNRSPWLMIPMALSVVASTGFSLYSYFREKQRRAAREREYTERLVELTKEMNQAHDQQRRFSHYNYPDFPTVARLVYAASAEAQRTQAILDGALEGWQRPVSTRAEARLWERRVSDDDFGVLRLGIGALPSTVIYVLREVENEQDPLVRAARKLEADSRFVSGIPIILSLRPQTEEGDNEEGAQEKAEDDEPRRTPATHTVAIAGSRGAVYEFVRALMAQYVVFHAPQDARLYLLATQSEPWQWTTHLPHCQADDQGVYTCFVNEREQPNMAQRFGDDEGSPLEQFLERLRKVLAQRKIRLQDRDEKANKQTTSASPTLPFLLVVVDLLNATFDQASPLRKLEADAAISILLEEGALLGAAILFLVPERNKAPGGCQAVIEIERTTPATNNHMEQYEKLHFRYAQVGVNSFRYVGAADAVTTPGELDDLAQQLTDLEMRQGFGANLTTAVPFLELMERPSLPALLTSAWQSWQASSQPRYANWLRVKVGRMSGNKARTLVFSAKRDGVHGMVAGSTGSGKSELLISLITALAVTYDPSILYFVLVDYKGGGAFKEFADLPHCVDIITNLEGDGVTRMFTAISAEMRRRQKLNADTGTKNIVDYQQKGLHLTHQPYPFLFIIIDEFAEMIADRAEYKAELESITRVGRAQGVSLLLAAQRPSGVTDQMRSNIKFRICLRVETPVESREMLRRTDAAFLPSGIPGRGYLQVGNDEIELIQVAYTGDKVTIPLPAVLWPDRHQRHAQSAEAQEQEAPELYKAIIEGLHEIANNYGIKRQRAPWPDFLPTPPNNLLTLTRLLISPDPSAQALTALDYLTDSDVDAIWVGQPPLPAFALNPWVSRWLEGAGSVDTGWPEPLDWPKHALRPVVGLLDNPYERKQAPLVIDLTRGHVVLFGASGWGKTTFVRTLVVSLAATHPPHALHLYLLDLGGRNLGALAQLPHVGALIIPDEAGYEERVEQLLRELDDLIQKRKLILSTAGASDLLAYNRNHPHEPLPALVVVIDNFLEFRETFGGEEDNVESVLDKFVAVVRQAKPYGVHVVITVNQLGSLPNHLYSLFTERLTLKLTDPGDYRAIVGGYVNDIPDIPGRGYTKIGRQPLSFQIALPVGELANESQELARLAQQMRRALAVSGRLYPPPFRIDALPRSVLFKELLAREHGLTLDAEFLPRLRAITQERWAASTHPDQADWLKVAIGVISGNRPRLMELEAKKDGVHGLIAGGTGAGKSELLMTLIVGLALNYDPSVLNFVLVDYKGGGAFKPFESLPHCVDIVTNLNKAGVRRMFTAINAEMQRRQKLNADTGTRDIVEYRRRGLHLNHAPYPHLFIIIDEYAEMISDSPEFRDELESITRVGRAQGVNLLLASQRPTGVTDQMRANIKFRICLRVEGVETSREMLRRSDAAYLPNGMPGRGYLQVGNENIELIQVAYTGESYPFAEIRERGEPPKFFDVVVQLANELLNGARPMTPWPPSLPHALTFATLLPPTYLEPTARQQLNLGRDERLTLNPFLQDWLAGRGVWPGIDWRRYAMRPVVGLVDNPHAAQQAPLVVDLRRGHAVIFGASGWGKSTFLRSLVVSLAATHSPSEFQAHLFDLGGRNLEVLRSLPHVGTVVMPDERGYEERVQQLLRELNEVVDQRKRLFAEAGVADLYEYNLNEEGADRPPEPAILLLVDNFGEFIETFGNTASKNEDDSLLAAFVALARQGKAYGLHVVITVTRLNLLSSKLYSLFTERLTLRLADATDYSGIVGSGVGEIEERGGRGYLRVERRPLGFQIAVIPGAMDDQGQVRGEARQIRALGEQMQAYIGQGGQRYAEPLRIDALPKSSSYRQVLCELFALPYEAPFVETLQAATARRWLHHRRAEEADWLQVTLGITSGNRKRTLYLEAKRDGVHGLIAGGTGSGKSELLMTLIVGLALNYPPDILNFVLVDYKGGGAFKPFEALPHCVDIVTNLNPAAVDRMFTAISAEIRRRQALNATTGTKDIVDYRKQGLHLPMAQGGRGIPYPHLFIIIDEYAEMIDANPDYRAELESITRVGRAQGVNLLLASQRPKGVSDQMRANIKLRLCLRVEELDTSREMLRRPDAALLPNGMPGRGYLQVGNENLELIQVSWTGETLTDEAPPVRWPDRVERPRQPDEQPKLYDAAVQLARRLAHGKMARKPWPGFLPKQFSLQSPLYDAQHDRTFTLQSSITDWLNGDSAALWPAVDWRNRAMRPLVGLYDDPAEAKQEPLLFDLSRNHLVVMGDAGMGKTTLLRTLIVSLAASHPPSQLHFYVLDLGGRNFRTLENLPHVGAVIYGSDESYEERLNRLLDKLNRVADARQQFLGDAGVSSLYEYNDRHRQKPLPAVLVVIDSFAELQENYEMLVEGTLLPLVRRSLSLGISFVVSCNTPNNMAGKLYNLFSERITFKQSNVDRYMDIVGRGALEFDDIPGRGYLRRERRPLMFHIAQPVGLFGEGMDGAGPSETDELQRLAQQMQQHSACAEGLWQAKPDRIATLPELLFLPKLLEEVGKARSPRLQAVLGMGSSLQPALFDLKRMGPHFAIVGPPLSGKTTTLYNWVLSLAYRYGPERVAFVLIDLQGKLADYGGKQQLGDLPHVLRVITEVEQLAELTEQLKREGAALAAQNGERELFLLIDNFDDFCEELERARELQRDLALLARRHGGDGLHFVIAGTLDSGVSELRRRVLASNYGIGLRSTQAVEALRVVRTPAGLRDKELPVGRGYIVRSGQATMLQVAAPYESTGAPLVAGDDEQVEALVAQALDRWVQQIQARYPGQRAAWCGGEQKEAPPVAASPANPQVLRMMQALQGVMQRELSQSNGAHQSSDLLVAKLLALNITHWNDAEQLMVLVKEAWLKLNGFASLPADIIPTITGAMSDEDFLQGVEQTLADGAKRPHPNPPQLGEGTGSR